MLVTSKELAQNLKIDYLEANRLLKLLISIGVAKEDHKVKAKGRGRPTIKYSIPDMVRINFMNGAPTKKTINIEVTTESPVLNVK